MAEEYIIDYTDEHREAWSDYVDNSPKATIAHQIGLKKVIELSLGQRPSYLMAYNGSKVAGILPLFIVRTWWGERSLISLPWIDYGGICADDVETEKALLARACRITENMKAGFMELRSVEAGDLNLAQRTDKVTFLLELDKDPEKIWNRFSAKLRNQIRKSQKVGLTTEYGRVEKLDEFYRVFSHNMRDLGTPVWGRDFFENIMVEFPNTAQLILVKRDEVTIAGGLVLSFKDRLYVPSASSYRSTLKYCPNHALYWSLIKIGCERGYRYFDFGRSSWHSHTFNFKKQWVSVPTQLTWQYYLNKLKEVPMINPNNPKYRLFIAAWRKLPLPVANFLGPKVIRNFP